MLYVKRLKISFCGHKSSGKCLLWSYISVRGREVVQKHKKKFSHHVTVSRLIKKLSSSQIMLIKCTWSANQRVPAQKQRFCHFSGLEHWAVCQRWSENAKNPRLCWPQLARYVLKLVLTKTLKLHLHLSPKFSYFAFSFFNTKLSGKNK